jgi:hypothetical protein
MRLVGRICYGIAATLGLLSLGVEWRNRQQRSRGFFPKPQSHTGLLVAMWAGIVALMGKVMEDAGQRMPAMVGTTGITGTRFGAYVPKTSQKRAKTLRSEYDLSDQYAESAANARPLATAR